MNQIDRSALERKITYLLPLATDRQLAAFWRIIKHMVFKPRHKRK